MPERILMIEDDVSGRELAVFNLENAGYAVECAGDGAAGLAAMERAPADLVITDVKMPRMNGMEVLQQMRQRWPSVPVVVITAYGDVETAVEAMKLGAADFVGKPFSRDHLLLVVERALAASRLQQEVAHLRVASTGVERPIIGDSAPMAELLAMADRFARSDASVLITGQSGTGKELVARRLHARSDRALGPFVPVNLAAIPDTLIEAELFGHDRGAFTGAQAARPGRFRQAHGGTLFLDEIGELAPTLQAKLLRVLQEKVVEPLGVPTPQPVDIRVVTATNRNLEEEIRAGRFREDLYYRINVVQLAVPPLCARTADIEPLVRHFVERHGHGRAFEIPESVFDALVRRPWPGNVRELENACLRLVLLAQGNRLNAADLPPDNAASPRAPERFPLPDDGLSLVDLEIDVIRRVLALKDGNVSAAAAYLNVPRHVLAYRMEKYGIERHG